MPVQNEVVLVYNANVPSTRLTAESIAAYLDQRRNSHLLSSAHDLIHHEPVGVRLAVCFGGDGTALRTARWLAGWRAPVVPVKMGKLSFLGELSTAELPSGLDPYLAADFWLDERAMLSVRHADDGWTALNDAVLARGGSPRAASIEVLVDDASAAAYLADGVIVSTATGSTAYSLAAGGPVVAPQLRSMVVTAVAPHLATLRSLVLPESARVTLRNGGHVAATLTVDGQVDVPVAPGSSIDITTAAETALFARRGERGSFYRDLANRLSRFQI